MNKANIKRSPSKKIICISAFVLVIVMLALGISYAWFRNTIELGGMNMHTGTFNYQFVGMYRDQNTDTIKKNFAYSTEADSNSHFDINTQSGFDPIPKTNGLSDVSDYSEINIAKDGKGAPIIATTDNTTGEMFFIVHKLENSVDLDVSIALDASLTALHDFDSNYSDEGTQAELDASGSETTDPESIKTIGGFWYSVDNVTGTQTGIDAIQEWVAESANFTGTRTEEYFPNIRNEIMTAELSKDNFWCFRLKYGLKPNAVLKDYESKVILSASLCVAQKGGLPDNEKSELHYANNIDQLKTALLEYRPGDTIIVNGDIEYLGDLIFNRPVKLQIVGSTLTVRGDLRYVYASRGEFSLDTASGGHLTVRKMDGIEAGGNIYCDIPNSSLSFNGNYSVEPGMADVYVEGNFSADVDDETGLTITRSRICDLSDALKTLILRQDSRISIAARTTVGTIRVPNEADVKMNAVRIQIFNMGTIEEIDLTSMKLSPSLAYKLPRILIDNYGKIERNGVSTPIKLPPWSVKWDPEENHPEQPLSEDDIEAHNTRVIHEQGAGEMSIASGTQKFITDHIEQATRITMVDKDPDDPTRITVHYMESGNLLGNPDGQGGTTESETTLQKIIEYYVNTADKSKQIPAPSEITFMEIICYGDYVLTHDEIGGENASDYSLDDYAYIRDKFSNLVSLDLRYAISKDKTVPDHAFSGLEKLTDVKMPLQDEVWGQNIFVNSGVTEIRLPTNLVRFEKEEGKLVSDSLTGIKYLHVENKDEVVIRDIGVDAISNMYLFCLDEETRKGFIDAIEKANNSSLTSYKGDILLNSSGTDADPTADKNNLDKISKIFRDGERYGDYYVRLLGDSCELITYVGENDFNPINERNDGLNKHSDGNVYRFDFKTFTINNDSYDVTRFDDFAFFGQNLANLGSDTLEFSPYLNEIGDAAFYDVQLPENVKLGGCKTLGHKALAFNTAVKILEAPYVEEVGFYACGRFGYGTVELMYFPRAILGYGLPFGRYNNFNPNRVHIGLMQTTTDPYTAVNSAYNAIYLSTGPTTVFFHTENAAANLSSLTPYETRAMYYNFVDEAHASVVNGLLNKAPKSLGNYTAEDVVFMADEKYQGAYAYLPIEGTEDEYKLIQCMYQSATTLGSSDEVYTVPAYVDKNGVKHNTTTVGIGAYHYATLHASTLTFDDSYKTVENTAFFNYNSLKIYDVLDLNKIETVGGSNAFRNEANGAPMFSLVAPNLKTATKTGSYGVFENCKQLRIASVPKLMGRTDRLFRGCERLEMASIGPITGEYLFSGRGYNKETNECILKTVFVDVSALEGNIPEGTAYLAETTSGIVDFSVISIGGPYSWENSANSPYKTGVVDPYATVIVDEGLNTIRFSDWKEHKAIDGNREFIYYMPTFLYAIQLDDTDTVSLEIAIDFDKVENKESFTVPSKIYKEAVGEGVDPTVTDILGNVTDRYTFDAAKAGDTPDIRYSIVEIGDRVFEKKLINVKTITFPESLKRIGQSAFAECKLGALAINGNGELLIDNRAFYGTSMDKLDITGVATIGESAFAGIYKDLASDTEFGRIDVTLGESIINIGKQAFYKAYLRSVSAKHSSVAIQEDVELIISEEAFSGLQVEGDGVEVTFNEVYVVVKTNAFGGTPISALNMQNMREINENAFSGAAINGPVDFSKSTGTIMPLGFNGMLSIESVTLGNGTRLKGDYAIGGNGDTINATNVIYKGAFTNCAIGTFNFKQAAHPDSLAFVGCSFENLNFDSMRVFATDLAQMGVGAKEYVDLDDVYTWRDASGKAITNLNSTRQVFRSCTTLGNVDLGNIETLGAYAFSSGDAKGLTIESIKQGETAQLSLVNSVGSYALQNVILNSSLQFKEGVTFAERAAESINITTGDLVIGNNSSVGTYAFIRCKISNGSLKIGSGTADQIMTISSQAFNSARVSGETVIGAYVKLDSQSFWTANLSSLTISNNVELALQVFNSATINGDVTAGDHLTLSRGTTFQLAKIYGKFTVGDNANFNAGNLFKEATITGDVTIGASANFANGSFGAAKLHGGSLTIGVGANIGGSAFSGLQIGKTNGSGAVEKEGSLTISENATIGTGAFTGLNMVKGDLVIKTGSSIGESAFGGFVISNEGNVSIENSCIIGANAFYDSTTKKGISIEKGNLSIGDGTNIGDYAFNNVILINGTISIGSGYSDETNDQMITLGSNAFSKAQANQLTVGDYVRLGASAFANAEIYGDASFGAYVRPSGSNALSTIEVIGDLIFGDHFSMGQNSFMGAATIGGSLVFGNNISVGRLLISGGSIGGNVEIGESADIGGDYGFISKTTIAGNVTIGKNASLNKTILSSTITGNLYVDENVIFEATAFHNSSVGGTFSLGSYSASGTTSGHTYNLFQGTDTKKTINRIEFRDTVTNNAIAPRIINNSQGMFRYIKVNELDLTNITSIGDYAFYNSEIKNIVNADNIKKISANAFASTTFNSNVEFSAHTEGITVNTNAFLDAQVNGSLTLNDVNTVESRAFDLTSAGDVTLKRVDMIKTNAFTGGTMTSLTINNVKKVEANAFAAIDEVKDPTTEEVTTTGVPGLRVTGDVTISAAIGVDWLALGDNIFYGAELGSLVDGELVNTVNINGFIVLNSYAFNHAKINGNMILDNNLKRIYDNAFDSAVILGDVTANAVTEARIGAFQNAQIGIEGKTGDVTLGALTTLQNNAFNASVIYGDIVFGNVLDIRMNAFMNATVYGTIDLESVTSVKADAFNGTILYSNMIFGSDVTVETGAFSGTQTENIGITFEGNPTINGTAFKDLSLAYLVFNDSATINANAAKGINIGTLNVNDGSTIGTSAFEGATIGTASFAGVTELGETSFKTATINGTLTFNGKTTISTLAFDGAKVGATTFNGGAEFGESAFAGAEVDGNVTFNSGATLGKYAFFQNATDGKPFKNIVIKGDLNFHSNVDMGEYAFDRAEIYGDLWFYKNEENPLRTNVSTIGTGAFYMSKINGDIHFAAGTLGQSAFKLATIGVEADPATGAEATGHIWFGNLTDVYGLNNSDYGAFNSAVINGGVNFEDVTGLHYCIFRGVSNIPYINTGAVTSFGVTGADSNPGENNESGRYYSVFSGIGTIGRLEMPNVVTLGRRTFTRITITEMAPFEKLTTINGAFGDGVKIKSDLIFNKHITTIGSSATPVFYGTTITGGSTTISGDVIFAEGLTAGTRTTFAEMTIGGDLYIKYYNSAETMDTTTDALMSQVTINGKFTIATGDVVGVISRGESHIKGGISFPDDGTNRKLTVYENNTDRNQAFLTSSIKGTVDLSGISEITNGFFYGVEFDSNTVIELPKATNIGENAFRETVNIVGVNAPVVNTIGNRAFYSVSSLASIDMPSVIKIADEAFSGCTKLTSIHAPILSTLGTSAFNNCRNIMSVYVPKLATINADAFKGCTSLKVIELPSVERFVGTSPFSGCTSLKTVIIGDKLENWGDGAFAGITSLERLVLKTVPSNITGGFIKLPNSDVKIALTDTLEELYESAILGDPDHILFGDNSDNAYGIFGNNGYVYAGIEQFQDYEFIIGTGDRVYFVNTIEGSPNKIEIVDMEFVNAPNGNVSNFVFPDTLTDDDGTTYTVASIGSDAMRAVKSSGIKFNKNSVLTLPANLEFINFDGRDVHLSLSNYAISENNPNFMVHGGMLYSKTGETLVLCPPGKAAEQAKNLTVTGPNGSSSMLIVAPRAFAGLTSAVENITFTQNLVIGDDAFLDCNYLQNIYLNSTTPSIFIGKNTFTGCSDALKVHVQNIEAAKNFVIYDTDVIGRFVAIGAN